MSIVRANNQAVLVQDPRLGAAELTATSEAGPIPGRAICDRASSMALDTSGTTTLTEEVRVQTQRAGHPAPLGATFLWRYGDPSSEWRGWDGPIAPTHFEYIDYDAATSPAAYRQPHAAKLPSGAVVVVACLDEQQTVAWRRETTGAWSTATIHTPADAFTRANGSHPCVVYVPELDRLVCFYWREATADEYQIAMAYSDDGGLTWQTGQQECLSSSVDSSTDEPGRIRAAYSRGRMVMFAAVEDRIVQFASDDGGATFTEIEEYSADICDFPEVVELNGSFVVAWLQYDAAASPTVLPRAAVLGSPYDALSAADTVIVDDAGSAKFGSVSGGEFTSGDLALWVDDDGVLFMAGRDVDDQHAGYTLSSRDGGVTWLGVGHGNGTGDGATWWRLESSSFYIRDFCAISHRGRTLLFHAFATLGSGSGQAPYSLCMTALGGYTTLTLPLYDETSLTYRAQCGWSYTWLAADMPEMGASPYTEFLGGSAVAAITALGLKVSHITGADQANWQASPTTNMADGVVALLDVDATNAEVYLSVRTSNGADSYEVKVTISATAITLRDVVAGVDEDTVATTELATGVQLLLAVNNSEGVLGTNGTACAWFRPRGLGEDREWTRLEVQVTLSKGSVATSMVQWGTSTGFAAAQAYFRIACYAEGNLTGSPRWAESPENPDDLLGRAYSIRPTSVVEGLQIAALGGPTYQDETWSIEPRYTYAIGNVDPATQASPEVRWRSTDETEQTITWAFGATSGSATRQLSPVLGLFLGRVNFRSATLYGRNTLGTWVSLGTVDTSTDQANLAYTRVGKMVLPGSSGASRHFALHELVGAHFDFDGADIRLIEQSSAGSWQASTMQTRIIIDEVDAAPASGAAGAILARDVCIVLPAAGDTSYYQFKLVIPAQATAEGYVEIGTAVLGPVFLFAHPYDYGRALEVAPQQGVTESRRGARRVVRRGAARRSVDLPFTSAMVTKPITASAPAADFVATSLGGQPWGIPADQPGSLHGLVHFLDGAVTPVVYLPSLSSSGVQQTLCHPTMMLYGRLMSESVRLDHVHGEDLLKDVWRGSVLRIEEEL